MKTGPHSFTDATGVEWHIVGYSRTCGAGYVDCRSTDGVALTVRPVAYLAPAGLTIPADAPPPERPASSAERERAQERYDEMPVKDIVPEAEQAEPPKPKRKPRKTGAQVIPIRPLEPITAEATDAARDLVGELQAAMTPYPRPEFVLLGAIGATPGRARVTNAHHEGYDVLIGRPGPWGNPYSHEQGTGAQHVVETRERAIDLYREWLRQRVRDGEPGLVQALAALHGLRLGCYCAPLPCHGDVLVDAAEWASTLTPNGL